MANRMAQPAEFRDPAVLQTIIETEPDRFLDRHQVEQIVGLSHSEIYRRMNRGEFPQAIKVGKVRVRWRERAIREWMAQFPS